MRAGSLFSGIGGMDLGLERAGMEIVWQVENDPYCQKILEKHWPGVRRHGDVKTFPPASPDSYAVCERCGSGCKKPVRETYGRAAARCYCEFRCDLICGGFPCQPVSLAGRRQAASDPRWLWPHFARIVRLLRPRYVLIENVPGLLSDCEGRIGRCLCGWLGRWRGMRLSTEEQGLLLSESGHRNEHKSQADTDGVREAFQGTHARQSGEDGAMGSVGKVDHNGAAMPAISQEDCAFYDPEEGSSRDADCLVRKSKAKRQRQNSLVEKPQRESREIALGATGIESQRTNCPVCGRSLAESTKRTFRPMSEVLGQLSEMGFDAEWATIPASAFGAPHKRERVFVVAYASGERRNRRCPNGRSVKPAEHCSERESETLRKAAPDRDRDCVQARIFRPGREVAALPRPCWGTDQPGVDRAAHGVPHRVERIRGLGNAVVPQVAEWIGRQIIAFDDESPDPTSPRGHGSTSTSRTR